MIVVLFFNVYNFKAISRPNNVTVAGKTLLRVDSAELLEFGQKNCDLKRHINTVHEKIKQFQCELCPKKFSQSIDLKRHVAAIHLQLKSFTCDICNQAFSQQCNLKRHKQTKHEKIRFS